MPSKTSPSPSPRRTCFVTIGATATFHSLVAAALSSDFLHALHEHGFTNLLIQYGQGSRLYEDFTQLNPPESEGRHDLVIEGFNFNKRGLDSELQLAKGARSRSHGPAREGVVISHAGRG
jgi:beta-1,4-N-acetylglucosaminyltransferase